MQRVVAIVVADDHPLVLHAVRHALPQGDRFAIVAECGDGRAALAAVRLRRADLLILDLELPGLSGLAVLQAIRAERLPTRVLVLSAHAELEGGMRAFQAGADGYLPKSAAPGELALAIALVARGKRFFRPAVVAAPRGAQGDDLLLAQLSDREFQVLKGVAEGRSNQEMSESLGLNAKAVSTHRNKVMRKLGVRHLRALLDFARNNHIVSE
jgi:two-component system invasion response regulator UvrY